MASQTNAVQMEIPTTVKLSAYLKEAKSGIVVAIVAQNVQRLDLITLTSVIRNLESQKRAKE